MLSSHTLSLFLSNTNTTHNSLFKMSAACFLAYLSFLNFIIRLVLHPHPILRRWQPFSYCSPSIKLFVALPISAIAFEAIAFTKTNKIFSLFRFYFIPNILSYILFPIFFRRKLLINY